MADASPPGPSLHTLTSVVADPAALEQAPSPSDLTDEHAVRPVAWSTRARSAVHGLVAGAFLVAVLLTVASIARGSTATVGAALALGVVLVLLVRRPGDQDARWFLAGLATAPAAWLGGVADAVGARPPGTALVVALLVLVGLAGAAGVHLHGRIARFRRDVLAWNGAFGRLAQDPRRALESWLDVRLEPDGADHRLVGDVVYVAVDGVERRVPLTTVGSTRVVVPADVAVGPGSPAVTWHAPDHSVVLTRVLAGPV